jgi:hypothetical protein
MAEVYKEVSKLDGMPVLQNVKMSAEGQPPSQSQGETQGQAQAPQAPPTSVGSALGSALGGRFGLGRRKKKDDTDQTAAPATQGTPGSLLEMTTELSNFSAAPVDASRFEVPAGFKQVESELKRMR